MGQPRVNTSPGPDEAGDARGRGRDRGSITVETVVILPLIVVLLFLVIGTVRLVHARGQIDQAADQAAIAAADAGPGPGEQAAAQGAATAVLNTSPDCASPTVAVNAGADPRTASFVTVTVSCAVPLSDLVVAGFPGHRTETARATVVRSLYTPEGTGP